MVDQTGEVDLGPNISQSQSTGGGGGGTPTGPAGGGLGGTYPNPTVDLSESFVLGSVTMTQVAGGSAYPFRLPASQGAANSVLTNNGSGTLTWVVSSGGGSGGLVGSVSLQNQVSGVLPVLNGGTGVQTLATVTESSSSVLVLQNFVSVGSASIQVVQGYISSTDWLRFDLKQPAGAYLTGSVSLVNQVRDSLALTQTTGSLSLTDRVSGVLPLTQTSGSISLSDRVSSFLPLSQTTGSISLSDRVNSFLPLTQTTGSLSLSDRVNSVLPLSQTSGSLSLETQTSGSLPLSRTTGSIDLTLQVSSFLPLSQTSGSLSLSERVSSTLPVTSVSGSSGTNGQVLQLVGGVPTWVTLPPALTGMFARQVFVSSGTWVYPANAVGSVFATITVVGGGGGGGGAQISSGFMGSTGGVGGTTTFGTVASAFAVGGTGGYGGGLSTGSVTSLVSSGYASTIPSPSADASLAQILPIGSPQGVGFMGFGTGGPGGLCSGSGFVSPGSGGASGFVTIRNNVLVTGSQTVTIGAGGLKGGSTTYAGGPGSSGVAIIEYWYKV